MASIFGTQWKLVSDKSVFSATDFKPTTETRQYDKLENGYKLTVKGTNKGIPYEWTCTASYDGKPHPVYGRDDVDAITIYEYGNGNTGGWFTKGGITVGAYNRSGTANALVVTTAGRLPDGKTYFDTLQYQH